MKNEVNLELVGMDGNAFAILGAFQREAKRAGWTPDEIDEVKIEAMSGDYDNLLATISSYCVNGGFGPDDEEDDDDDWYEEEEEDEDE
jgi:hypothetical protein